MPTCMLMKSDMHTHVRGGHVRIQLHVHVQVTSTRVCTRVCMYTYMSTYNELVNGGI